MSEALHPESFWLLTGAAAFAAAGSLIGAGLLLVTAAKVFSGLVPWLQLLATTLCAASPWLTSATQVKASPPSGCPA